jgi:putative Mn2+ efflux pump MntP
MKKIELKLPELGLFAITRVGLGVGIGFLLSTQLDKEQRRAAGAALILIGVLTTVPFAVRVLGSDD